MENIRPQLTGDLARAGRALAQVSFQVVAERAGVDPERLRSFERGNLAMSVQDANAIQDALEYFGIHFLPEDTGGGYGVRRRIRQGSVQRIENWENEGGPAGEDDI
jgi:transcriptional regulator with XRE-family HTH domain